MSRQKMIVSSGMRSHVDELDERRLQLAVAGAPLLVLEPEEYRRCTGAPPQIVVVGLGQVDEPLVVAEPQRDQLWVCVELERPHDQRLEMAREEIGQVVRAE